MSDEIVNPAPDTQIVTGDAAQLPVVKDDGGKFTPELREKVLDQLADGVPLKTICKLIGIGIRTVQIYTVEHPEYSKEIDVARELGAHAMDAQLAEDVDATRRGEMDAMTLTSTANVTKWRAARHNQRFFGEISKQEVKHSGEVTHVKRVILEAPLNTMPRLEDHNGSNH